MGDSGETLDFTWVGRSALLVRGWPANPSLDLVGSVDRIESDP